MTIITVVATKDRVFGVGISSFDEIEFLTDSPESEALVEKIKSEF